MRQVGRLGGLALAVLLALGGCDGSGAPSASSSTAQAKAKGKVTLNGKPLAKVEVRFNAANVNRKTAPTATAIAGDDGSYEVTTLVGENMISLGGPEVSKHSKQLTYFSQSANLTAGENKVDLDIP